MQRPATSDIGLHIDIYSGIQLFPKGDIVIQSVAAETQRAFTQQRIGHRRLVRVPGRLTWRDASGTLRFASVVTRDVSDVDVFVECQVPASIPLYRLVHFQIEGNARECDDLPAALQQGKVLSAVYRVGPYKSATGTPHGYALRLLVDPRQGRGRANLVVANSN